MTFMRKKTTVKRRANKIVGNREPEGRITCRLHRIQGLWVFDKPIMVDIMSLWQ
ncbi:Protein of unknown function [Pyronema omphalodes CBS 100304]|uniref:Uncharacterized protein n=1 Tax=Pyronema omphalodes (strain CBS 100304) TaxID=1076935 RepID=U4LU14_PYROM|nr:Protein of unknown function [Pyronema omphalodes CBS 100304]